MRYLAIAEKNSAMRALQSCYEKNKAVIVGRLGGEIDFLALSGHVCQWLEPRDMEEYRNIKWADLSLPIIPEKFLIKAKTEDYPAQKLAEVRDAVESGMYSHLIVATDSDAEGNAIFTYMARYLGIDNWPTLRFFETSLTEKEILASFLSMTDFYTNERDIRMTDQAITRSQHDWLVGMNGTISVTVRAGVKFNVGRVKAPTLYICYLNDQKISSFVQKTTEQLKVNYLEGFSGVLVGNDLKEIEKDTKEEIQAIIEQLKDSDEAVVTKIEKKQEKKNPEQLYKLSGVQTDTGEKFGFTAEHCQAQVQSNYEKGILSYPRTNGCCVSTEKAKEFPAILKAIATVPELKELVERVTEEDIRRVQANKRVVNDESVKAASHDALIPTAKIPPLDSLTDDERMTYVLIAKRFLSQFLPPLVEDKTVLYADIDGYSFKSRGTVIVDPGWTVLYDRQSKSEIIPEGIEENDFIYVDAFEIHDKVTEPPKRLTEGTLIAEMEGISKYIEDEDLKKAMRAGIGTQATRAEIIKELKAGGFIRTQGKKNTIFITDLGKKYIETLKGFSIINPEEAARWETMFQDVREGKLTFAEARQRTDDYVRSFIEEVGRLNIERITPTGSKFIVADVSCPYCGKKIKNISHKGYFACEDYFNNRACGFVVNTLGGKFTVEDLKSLIKQGRTRKIKNIGKTKDGNTFDAGLKLNPKGSVYVTAFDFGHKKRKK